MEELATYSTATKILRTIVLGSIGYIVLPFLYQIIYYRYFHPLKGIPGPFWATVTRIWGAYHNFLSDETPLTYAWLKKLNATAVRISPNLLFLSSAKYLPIIYHRTVAKSQMYITGSFGEAESVFNIQPHAVHAYHRKLIAGPYSFSKVIKTEPLMDERILEFISRIEKFEGKQFDLAPWGTYVAFDIISQVGFGKPFGFVEKGGDVGGLIEALHDGLVVFGVFAKLYPLMEWIKTTWFKKHVVATPEMKGGMGVLMRWRDRVLEERMREIEQGKRKEERVDLLQGLLEAKTPEEKPLDIEYIKAEMTLVFLAGADTTGTAFGSIITYLLSHPDSLAFMLDEITGAYTSCHLSRPVPKYREVLEHCPYYIACVKESMRLSPPAPANSSRIYDGEGGEVVVNGKPLPKGIEVAMNAWIAGRDKEVYGEDAEVWRPERWLEASEEEKKLFERSSMVFGYGSRGCLGKDIAMMELMKTPLTLFLNFEVTPCGITKATPKPKEIVRGGILSYQDIWVTIRKKKL